MSLNLFNIIYKYGNNPFAKVRGNLRAFVGMGCLKITRPGVSQHPAQITQGFGFYNHASRHLELQEEQYEIQHNTNPILA
jgi:hypothetical protein